MKNMLKKMINIRLLTISSPIKRAEYLRKKSIFKEFGENVWYQPYKIPTQPKLVEIWNNVKIATEVLFMEHDIIHHVFNTKCKTKEFKEYLGTIEIGDNTFIGARTIITYNTKIGEDCIIGCGSIVTHDIPSGSVAVGIPARVIGKTTDIMKKYKKYSDDKINLNLYDDDILDKLFWN